MKKRSFIFVSGFGWTGASALVDYLKDFEGFEKTPCGEVPFLNALHQIIEKLNRGESLNLEKGKNEQIFLAKTPKDFLGSRKEFFESKIHTFYANFRLSRIEYEDHAKKCLLNISKCIIDENIQGLRNNVTSYLLFLNENMISEDLFIYDNAIPGQSLSFFNLVDSSKIDNIRVYIMDRDPRDQYYEIMQKYNLGHVSKNNRYIHYLNKLLDLFKPIKNILSSWYFTKNYYLKRRENLVKDIGIIRSRFGRETVKVLEFGEFVKNIDLIRNKLKIDLEKTFLVKYHGHKNFNPKVSEKNIGVYKINFNDNRIGYWWIERKTKFIA